MRTLMIALTLVACGAPGTADDGDDATGDTGMAQDTTFPQLSGGNSSSAQFALVFDTLRDADEDGRWEPGELGYLSVTMTNTGADDFDYPGCELSSDDLASGQGEWPFFGIAAGDSNLCEFTLTPLTTAVSGDIVEVDVFADRLNCTDDCPEANTLTIRFQLEAD